MLRKEKKEQKKKKKDLKALSIIFRENHFQKEVEKNHKSQVLRLTGYLLGQDV